MRRLALLALLLVVPAAAHADGLPGTGTYFFYPLTGCTVTASVPHCSRPHVPGARKSQSPST